MRFLKSLLLTMLSGCIIFCALQCTQPPRAMIQNSSDSSFLRTSTFTIDSTLVTVLPLRARGNVRLFYHVKSYAPAWTVNLLRTPAADTMIRFIDAIAYCGLNPESYHHQAIHELLQYPLNTQAAAKLDILLTDGFFSLYTHLKKGRVEKETLTPVTIETDNSSVLALFDGIRNNTLTDILRNREPQTHGYQSLKKYLKAVLDKKLPHSRPDHTDSATILALNMERLRWETQSFPAHYIYVTIPAYKMRVVRNDTIKLWSKVVVGTPDHATPELNSFIYHFVLYPYWNVPRSIATKELLPLIQKDTGYLRKHQFEVLDAKNILVADSLIDWSKYNENNLPFRLRQREGIGNAMGIIKFVFPNPYGVYLHDTNAKRFFAKEQRALSHGCVRVEKARQLAYYLVDQDLYYSREDLELYFNLKQQVQVDLMKPIPVYLRYYTCETLDSTVHFYADIYKKDSLLLQAIRPASREQFYQ